MQSIYYKLADDIKYETKRMDTHFIY